MNRINYLLKYYKGRPLKKKNIRSPYLDHNPQRKAHCMQLTIRAPKKPNSAKRKIAKVWVYHLSKAPYMLFVYIPGEGHKLIPHSHVLIRGGRTKDLPGLRYRAIRGVYDLTPVYLRRQGRSKYGMARRSILHRKFCVKKWY